MSPWQIATVAVLVVTVLASWWRVWRQQAQAPRWRRGVLMLLQPLCALALYLLLYPPLRQAEGNTLVVLGAGAASVQAQPGEALVALPEAAASNDVTRVPDLATALRQRPGTARLRVVGQGLPARDREAVGTLPLAFQATATQPGLVGLSTPASLAPGNAFAVQGQVAGLPGARVELLDPAGRRVDAAPTNPQGRFVLNGQGGIAGDVLFAVRVLDAAGTERDRQAMPLQVRSPAPLRVWILAGAPQPEWKFLRRWAADAGLSLHTQIAAGGGLQLGDAPLPLDAATLDRFDLLWLDDRALAALSRAQREAVLAAARLGLGVLVRLGGPLDANGRAALVQWGLPMRGGDASTALAWPATSAAATAAAPGRRDFAPATALPVLASDAKSVAYAWWRSVGQGRIGVTSLVDSYRLPLAGESAAHARLWSTAVSALARAQREAQPGAALPALAWSGTRMTLCGLTADAVVRDPTGKTHALASDGATGERACAGYWPIQAGWHVLVAGERQQPFLVRDPATAQGWFQHEQAEATARLVRDDSPAPVTTIPGRPGSRWPAWWIFVCLIALCAWLERPRRV